MQWTLIDANGIVVNHVVADENWQPPAGLTKIPYVAAPIGQHHTWEPPPPEPAKIKPTVVSAYQARVALYHAGLLDAVEAMVSDPNTAMEVKLAWEYATEFHRDNPFILALAPQLGLTEEQLDALFEAAAQVQ